ncbi:hypothetical protein ACVIN2_002092 [Bradyrhizobium sp. USDA 3650]
MSSCSPGERSDTRDRCESPGCRFAHPGYKTLPSGKTAGGCQSVAAKIFRFTEIRFWRMCRPSRLILEGRSCGRHVREPGLRWTRQRSGARSRAGRIALREPKASFRRAALLGLSRLQVSGSVDRAGKTAAKWRAVRTAKPCGPGRRCYGQAVAEVCASPTGRTASLIRGAREARRKVRLPGEHGISRPTIAQGRPSDWLHLYAAVRFSCVCFSRSGPRVPAGTRPSLRPLGQEGGVTKQSSGETRREDVKLCLQIKMRAGRVALPPHTPSLRAQRSNPVCRRGGILDCFRLR